MTRVPLANGWSVKLSLTEFREWCRQRLILEDDYDFAWEDGSNAGVNASIIFKDDNDALAFRLKFGI